MKFRKVQKKEWTRKNPEKKAASEHKRRSRKLLTVGAFSAADVIAILKLQKGRCAICRDLIKGKRHIDHIKPLATGGSNDRRNIQVTHPKCNMSKGSKDPIAFMQSLGYLL